VENIDVFESAFGLAPSSAGTKRRTAIFLLLAAFAGCASGLKIKTRVDPVTGRSVDRLEGNKIGPIPCGLTRDPCVFLDAERISARQGATHFRLVAVYEGEEWLFVQPGKTLEFELSESGQNFALFGEGSKENRKILAEKKLRETAFYEISPNNLQRLADAKKVTMKLRGDGFYVERTLTAGNLRNLQSFAQKFIGK